MASSKRPDPEVDEDALTTLVDEPAPDLDAAAARRAGSDAPPVLPSELTDTDRHKSPVAMPYEEADTAPGQLPESLSDTPPDALGRGELEDADTEAHPIGVPLDQSWVDDPPLDPFGEAPTVARERSTIVPVEEPKREVSPDDATIAVKKSDIVTDATIVAGRRVREVAEALAEVAKADASGASSSDARGPEPLAALPSPAPASVGDAEATIKVLSLPPDAIRSLRAEAAKLAEEIDAATANTVYPPPSSSLPSTSLPRSTRPSASLPRATRHPQDDRPERAPRTGVDPEQALGFMTVGLLVGLGMSALVVFLIAGWLFTAS